MTLHELADGLQEAGHPVSQVCIPAPQKSHDRGSDKELVVQISDDVFWQNYKKFRDEEQKMMQAELAKVQQAMQMQQAGGLPMPWDGASPPAARVRILANSQVIGSHSPRVDRVLNLLD